MNDISHRIEVTESDGYKRGGVAYPIHVTFAEAELNGTGSARITHPDGRELPVQIDVDETWPDGSVRSCDVIFPLHLPANGSGTYTLETGARILPSAEQRNPVQIDTTETGLTINQGPVTYTVRTNPFSVVDTAVFNRDVWKGTHPTGADISGPKPFLLRALPDPRLSQVTGRSCIHLAPRPSPSRPTVPVPAGSAQQVNTAILSSTPVASRSTPGYPGIVTPSSFQVTRTLLLPSCLKTRSI